MNRWLTLALASVLLAACGKGDLATNNSTDECRADSDCSGDTVCRQNLCTLAETSPRALGFRLVPPPSSTYPAQTVAIRDLPADEPVQIGLDPGVRVAGALSWVGSDGGPGSGRLKFKRHGDDFTAEAAVEANDYETYLPAGTYDITFFPDDPKRPTRVWNEVKIALDTDPRLQLEYKTVEISGTLSRTDATSRESASVPNALVYATSRETGVTSSVSTTDEAGNFAIQVPPNSGAFDLHIAPAEPNAYGEDGDVAAYVPDAAFEEAFEVEAEDWVNTLDGNEQADVLGVSLGEYAYSPLSIPVRLEIDGSHNVDDWTGTSVTLRTTAGRGVISVRQRLGADGEFALPLVLGLYDAVIRTPASLPVRSMEISNIEIDPQGIVLHMEPRTNAAGEIRGPDGAALAGTQLRFEPLADGTLAEQVSVTTDDDGRFQVWLENEPYLLTVLPTDPTLPRRVLVVRDADVPDVIEVGEPVLVWGTVFGTPPATSVEEWRGLGDVSVHVIEADADGDEHVIGEGQTNENGDFKVVISARP